jgi:hypothetical protein
MHQHAIVEIFSTMWWTGLISSNLGIVLLVMAGKYSSPAIQNRLPLYWAFFFSAW